MSLYTPVFPSFHEPNSTHENTQGTSSVKQQNYIEFLRDIHLFLSTQNDILSPPSRPNSPLFDHRVQEVRDKIQGVVDAAEGKTSSGKWACVSQTLKLGCVRGRRWSVSGLGPYAPEEGTNWILPEEESEWIEWEKKREESRRLKGKTNASQRTGTAASAALETNHASFAELSQPHEVAREQRPSDVSPTILRAAREKVKKWQASVSSDASTRVVVAETSARKSKTEGPQRSRTIDFAVVMSRTRTITGKKEKGSVSRLGHRGGSPPIPWQSSKSSTPPKATDPPPVSETGSREPPKASAVKDDTQKIAGVPETQYLPPSFPAHLETSTPLPDSLRNVRTKPSPILPFPASSSTPLPSASADPPDECQLSVAEPHAANVSSCLPAQLPQFDTVQTGKRSRALSPSLGISNDPSVTQPAKRLRTESQSRATPSPSHSRLMSPNVGLDVAPCIGDDARDPRLGSHRDNIGTLVMALGVPSTPARNDYPPKGTDEQGFPKKIPSPTKSVKSCFSAADSDPGDSPLMPNLLLESPVSPMLSYAQNASSFLPQITSTQVERRSPSAGRTNHGLPGMGYSSQFDVERHVDRVSELLERDVDFDGWLRDARTVERSQD